MIELRPAASARTLRDFFSCSDAVYRSLSAHRRTEDDVARLLLAPRSAVRDFYRLAPFVAYNGSRCVGRFLLAHNRRCPEMVTIGFFEAAQDSPELLDLASRGAELFAPQAKILAAGIGAHLNYQAGFSLDAFDRVPAFGMPHSAPWYPEWFSDWKAHTMRSWEFETAPFFSRLAGLSRINDSGIRVRPLSFARLSRDIALYTELNNRCFADHPFWINRAPAEDLDLFLPFRPFLNPENLLFAEKDGKAIGFLLWYPDFNQLNPSGGLGLPELVNYRLAGRLPGLRGTITRFRLTQIAVLPEYRSSDASLKMISAIAPFIQRAGYTAGEAGFIFDDNAGSLALTSRFFSRVLGMTAERMKPKRFAVYTRGME